MKTALYQGEVAHIWVVGRETEQADWVKELFDKQVLVWLDDHVRVYMHGLPGATPAKVKADWRGYAYGFEGEVLDVTNLRLVSRKQFLRDYQPLD